MSITSTMNRLAWGLACLSVIVGVAPASAGRLIQQFTTGRVTAGTPVPCNDANGFVHWDRRDLAFFHNTANQGAGKAAALTAALNSWTNVSDASHVLSYAGTTTAGFVTDNRNTLVWALDGGCPPPNCLALTALVLDSNQVIVESDVVFNNGVTWTTNGSNFDTEAVAAHEIGHALGLHHTEVTTTPRPTMFATYFGTDERSLEADDQNALRCSETRYPIRPVVLTNAASFATGAVAPDSIASAFGTNLATATASSGSSPLPTSLGGTYVRVIDSAGTGRRAGLFFISPSQVNLLVPAASTLGACRLVIVSGAGDVSSAPCAIAAVAPGVFTANASGGGLAAAQILRVNGGGGQTVENVADASGNPIPINFGPPGDSLFLILYGTGVKGRSSLGAVSVNVGGTLASPLFAGPQGTFAGEDQINAGPLSRGLAGAGTVNVQLTVDGINANTVTLVFQ